MKLTTFLVAHCYLQAVGGHRAPVLQCSLHHSFWLSFLHGCSRCALGTFVMFSLVGGLFSMACLPWTMATKCLQLWHQRALTLGRQSLRHLCHGPWLQCVQSRRCRCASKVAPSIHGFYAMGLVCNLCSLGISTCGSDTAGLACSLAVLVRVSCFYSTNVSDQYMTSATPARTSSCICVCHELAAHDVLSRAGLLQSCKQLHYVRHPMGTCSA